MHRAAGTSPCGSHRPERPEPARRSRSATSPGSQTVTRTVTNVGVAAGTYTRDGDRHWPASRSSLRPRSRSRRARPQTFTADVRADDAAPLNAYAAAQITWSDGAGTSCGARRHPAGRARGARRGDVAPAAADHVRRQVGLRPARSPPPPAASSRRRTRSTRSPDDPTDSDVLARRRRTRHMHVVVTSRRARRTRRLLRCSTRSRRSGRPRHVRLQRDDARRSSGGGTSAKEVNLLNPAAATSPSSSRAGRPTGRTPTARCSHWLLGSTAAGNMTVTAPATPPTTRRRPAPIDARVQRAGAGYEVPRLASTIRRHRGHCRTATIVRVSTP